MGATSSISGAVSGSHHQRRHGGSSILANRKISTGSKGKKGSGGSEVKVHAHTDSLHSDPHGLLAQDLDSNFTATVSVQQLRRKNKPKS